jgi:ABC-2 type transport system ATP-binding protein
MLASLGGQMSHAPLARLDGAHKSFGKIAALNGLDLAVHRGELLALLGPNGAGKSTAVSILLGLQRPDRGVATLFDADPQDVATRRRIGVMMQEVNLPSVMRPHELIRQVASYYPSPYDTRTVLEKLELQKLADRPYGKLSGGQKRQVQFALAICGRPELLFLDEPTVGLDVQAREALWRVLRDLLHEGCSIVLTTHYLEEAEALASRVAVMAHGQVVAQGSVEEIRAHVSRKTISFRSALPRATVEAWPEVLQWSEQAGRQHVVTREAEAVLRRLLATDAGLQDVEVRRAGLAEAFAEITASAQSSDGRLS